MKNAITLAVRLKDIPMPKIEEDLSAKKIESRFSKLKRKFLNCITKDLPIVTSDASRVEELHKFRKCSKKLRYLLEMLPKEHNTLSKLIKVQNKLGTIHDFDITISFLNRCKQESMIQSIIQNESYERNNRFQEFVTSITEFLGSDDKDSSSRLV